MGIAIVVGLIGSVISFCLGVWFANNERMEELAIAKARMRRLEEENIKLRQIRDTAKTRTIESVRGPRKLQG